MRNTQLNSNGVGVNRSPTGGSGIIEHTPTRTLSDYAGREAFIGGFGDQVVAHRRPEMFAIFNYFVNPNQVNTSLSSGGFNITTNLSRLQVTAGVGAVTGEAIAQSVRNVVYRPGFDAYSLLTCAFDEDKPGTAQDFGPHDDINGYSIAVSGATISVKHFRGGSILTNTPAKNFLLDKLDGSGPSKFTINAQGMNIYRINYGYLGTLPPYFEIYGGVNKGWVPFHYIDHAGVDNRLLIDDPYLPIKFVASSDGTNEVSMYSGSWQGGIIAADIPRHLNDPYTIEHKIAGLTGGSITKPIVSLKNNTTFKTKSNKIELDLDTITGAVDGNKIHTLLLLKNTSLSGPTSYAPVDSTSIVDIDTTSTGLTGGEIIRAWDIGKIDSLGNGVDFDNGDIRILPGDIITYAVLTASTGSDIGVTMHWEELK